jgi:hypothetical protein
MSLIRTYLAGKARQIKREQHWSSEMADVVRPLQIKARAAEQIVAVETTLKADPELMRVFKTLKLTTPAD